MNYPGEKQLINEVINAYRSVIKYQNITGKSGQLRTIYSIASKLANGKTGKWRQLASEMIPQLISIDRYLKADSLKNNRKYNSDSINNAIDACRRIVNMSDNDRPENLFGSIARNIDFVSVIYDPDYEVTL